MLHVILASWLLNRELGNIVSSCIADILHLPAICIDFESLLIFNFRNLPDNVYIHDVNYTVYLTGCSDLRLVIGISAGLPYFLVNKPNPNEVFTSTYY